MMYFYYKPSPESSSIEYVISSTLKHESGVSKVPVKVWREKKEWYNCTSLIQEDILILKYD